MREMRNSRPRSRYGRSTRAVHAGLPEAHDEAPFPTVQIETRALLDVGKALTTPISQRPIQSGIELVVALGSNKLSGHTDRIHNYVDARDPARMDQIHSWRTSTGGVPGRFEAW